jgi:uncharacterized protein
MTKKIESRSMPFTDHLVTTLDQLESMHGEVYPPARVKEIDHVNADYRAFIETAPFVAMATGGAGGLDCSPRGDPAGFVRVHDEKTLMIPDRRGNNRIDTLRNLVEDPRIALLFLIPGCSETIRVNGRAQICVDPELCQSFEMQGRAPRCVIVVSVERAYFQCAKAIVRSKLWDPQTRIDRASLPTSGSILAHISGGKIGGPEHDRAAPERMKATIY